MAHTDVLHLRNGLLRIPLVNSLNQLPRSLRVHRESLPDSLNEENVATKDELRTGLADADRRTLDLIAQVRTSVLEEVEEMLDGLGVQGYVFRQEMPVTVADLQHDFNRDGPVHITMFSPDYQIQYEFFETFILSENVARVGFDDPTAFVAVVL